MYAQKEFRSMLRSLPVWLATIAIFLHPLLIEPADCSCLSQLVAGTSAAPCDLVPALGACNCDPAADVCHCGDCQCGVEESTPDDLLPAVPSTQDSNEIQIQISLISFPFEHLPIIATTIRTVRMFADEISLRTAQQTCVLFSRFNC